MLYRVPMPSAVKANNIFALFQKKSDLTEPLEGHLEKHCFEMANVIAQRHGQLHRGKMLTAYNVSCFSSLLL